MATSFLHSLGATLKTGLKYLGCSTPDLLNMSIHSTQVCIVMIIMPNQLPVACLWARCDRIIYFQLSSLKESLFQQCMHVNCAMIIWPSEPLEIVGLAMRERHPSITSSWQVQTHNSLVTISTVSSMHWAWVNCLLGTGSECLLIYRRGVQVHPIAQGPQLQSPFLQQCSKSIATYNAQRTPCSHEHATSITCTLLNDSFLCSSRYRTTVNCRYTTIN